MLQGRLLFDDKQQIKLHGVILILKIKTNASIWVI